MDPLKLTDELRDRFLSTIEDRPGSGATAEKAYLIIHDYPDPDALASAAAIKLLLERRWGIDSIICGLHLSRPQNRTLANLLNIELHDPYVQKFDNPESLVIMLDCNPGSGNVSYLTDNPEFVQQIDWVIDHHVDKNNPQAEWCDIAAATGSTCTRVVDYLRALEFTWDEDNEVDGKLASAMMLGISIDTDHLRSAYERDMQAYWYLRESYDLDAYDLLEKAEIPPYYMDALHDAHDNRQQVGSLVVSSVGVTTEARRDVLAFIADLYITVKDVNAVIIYGIISNKIMAVTRVKGRGPITAADLARDVFRQPDGGGRSSDKSDKSGVTVVLNQFFDMDLLNNGSKGQFLDAIKAIIVARAKRIVDIDE